MAVRNAGDLRMKQGLEMWDKVADKIINKERIVAGRNRGKIPYTTVSPHVFDDQSPKEKGSLSL